MQRFSMLVIVLLVGISAAAAFVVYASGDEPSPSVNVVGSSDEQERAADNTAPLEDDGIRPETNQGPDDGTEAQDSSGSLEDGLVVTGSVTATAGTLPATLLVTALSASGEPQELELKGTTDFRFEFDAPGPVAITAVADSWYQLEPVALELTNDGAQAQVELAPAALLNGRIDGKDGSTLGGAEIRLTSGGNPAATTTTDASGFYSFNSLRPAAYRAEVTYGDNTATESLFVIVGDNTEDITIDAGPTLTLRMLDDYGNPITIADSKVVTLYLYNNYYAGFSDAIADASGRAGEVAWRGLKAARYMADVRVPGFEQKHVNFTVTDDEHVEEITLSRGGMLTGEVIVSGKLPKRAVYVRATREGKQTVAQLDEENRFEFPSLGLGEHTIELVDMGGKSGIVASETVEITGGTQSIRFELDVGAILEVELILNGATAKTINAWVQLSDENGSPRWTQASDGVATFAFLSPGSHTVSVRPAGGTYANLQIDIAISEGTNVQRVTLREPNCLKVTMVAKDSNAEKAGLRVNDMLIQLNNVDTASLGPLKNAIAELAEGDAVSMTVVRDGVQTVLRIDSWTGRMLGINAEPAYSE